MRDLCAKSWGDFYPGHLCKQPPCHDGPHRCGCGTDVRSETDDV